MRYDKVTITLDDDVLHHDKVIDINVMGSAIHLANAIAQGRFKVTYTVTEETTTEVKVMVQQ